MCILLHFLLFWLHFYIQACEEGGIDPKMLPEGECLEMLTSNRDIFVLDSFDGKVFKYLSKHKAR